MISPRAPVIGLPTLRLSSWASSSLCSLIRAASLASDRPRLPAAQVAQPLRSSNAVWAAATARSTSSRPPSGAVAMTLPVAGSTTSNVWPSAASTDSPPMTMLRASSGRRPAGVVSVRHRSRASRGRVGASETPGRRSGRRRRSGSAGARRRRDDRRGRSRIGPAARRLAATIAAPMIPASLRRARDDRRPDGQPRDEPVGVLADAAAEDHQVRPDQLVDPVEVLVEVGRPGLPRQPAPDPGDGRRARSAARPRISIWPNSVFGTRTPSLNTPDPTPVPRVRKMTTPGWSLPTPKRISAIPAASASLMIDDRALEQAAHPLDDREVDPGRVDVGGRT